MKSPDRFMSKLACLFCLLKKEKINLKKGFKKVRIIKMQPLGAIGDLEADASCQEEEDEEEEAVWLREQGHCKMRSVQDHPFQGSAIGCSSNR